ncbi:MAG: Cys-tRNA(Pro) deacylase [Pseudomonadota bacterium]
MTPAIKTLEKAGVPFKVHEYQHVATSDSFGLEAAEKLGVPADRVFKTLVADCGGSDLVVGIIPVSHRLSTKRLARAAGAKKAAMATPSDVERTTGYVLGGISPLGQRKRLSTFIDHSALHHSSIFVSAGRRGLEIELSPEDLTRITEARLTDLCAE